MLNVCLCLSVPTWVPLSLFEYALFENASCQLCLITLTAGGPDDSEFSFVCVVCMLPMSPRVACFQTLRSAVLPRGYWFVETKI